MTDPYIKANPGDPILSEHWNTIQVRMIEALRTHTHLGGDDGKKLGGGGIDPETTLSVKQLNVSTTLTANQLDVPTALTVKGINVSDRLTGLGNEKLSVTGGTISGPLSVTGNVGLGTTTPNKQLTLASNRSDNHAPMEVRGSGNAGWGIGLVVRTTGGQDGGAILLRSREKSWQVRGETGATATGFQITEDGGDAEYGSGWGTPRLHIRAGGNVGIGTTSPQSALHVAAQSSVLARIEAGGSGGWAEVDLYSTYGVANQRYWNLAARGHGGFVIRQLNDARTEVSVPLTIDTTGTMFTKTLQVQGDLYAANSGLYFNKTDHDHSGIGNTQGYAAIENASNFGALMIMGRSTPAGRIVKLWDYLEVNGSMKVTGDLSVGGRYVPHYASNWVERGANDTAVIDFNVGFFPVLVSVMARMSDAQTYTHIRPGAQGWDDIYSRDETVYFIVNGNTVRIHPSKNSGLGAIVYDGPSATRSFRVLAWRGD
jgi:hypothetical protein